LAGRLAPGCDLPYRAAVEPLGRVVQFAFAVTLLPVSLVLLISLYKILN